MRVMDSAEENNHPTDAPAVESNVVIHVRGNSSRYFEKAGYRLELVDENGDNNPQSLMGMDAHHEDVYKRQGYRWWIDRFRASAALYDIIRIDHFRGFEGYYAIPGGAATARDGVWRQGPGIELFHAVRALSLIHI